MRLNTSNYFCRFQMLRVRGMTRRNVQRINERQKKEKLKMSDLIKNDE